MTQTLRVRLGAGFFIGAAALSIAACGSAPSGPPIKADNAAKTVSDFVSKNAKLTVKNVKCPDGLTAKVGLTFDCTYTAKDGDYVAHMTVNKVDGTAVGLDVKTERAK